MWVARRIVWCCSAIRIAWGETSFKVGVVFCTLGIVIGLILGLGMTRLVVLIAIALLGWGLEIANSSIETLLDIVHPEYSPKVKVVKDAFSAVPIFVYSAYAICWLVLVAPTLYHSIADLVR